MSYEQDLQPCFEELELRSHKSALQNYAMEGPAFRSARTRPV
jgi:hypothetical protein